MFRHILFVVNLNLEYDSERDVTKMVTDSIRALRVGGYIVNYD